MFKQNTYNMNSQINLFLSSLDSAVPHLLTPKVEMTEPQLSTDQVHFAMPENINNNNNSINTTPTSGVSSIGSSGSSYSFASTSTLLGAGGNSAPPSGRQPPRRRARRRATSASSDPAEQLTEMSVRGLNLFRYASVNEGVYQCTECAKVDVQKTFKNKYSFQRHAFLYHEGHQRKVFPCPVCAKEFSRPDKMKNHMKTVHDCFMPKDVVFPMGFFLPH